MSMQEEMAAGRIRTIPPLQLMLNIMSMTVFPFIAKPVFCTIFGILVIAMLKPLKRLTHGAEEREGTSNEETEGFELADGSN